MQANPSSGVRTTVQYVTYRYTTTTSGTNNQLQRATIVPALFCYVASATVLPPRLLMMHRHSKATMDECEFVVFSSGQLYWSPLLLLMAYQCQQFLRR